MKQKVETGKRGKPGDRLFRMILIFLIVLMLAIWALCGLIFSDPFSGSVNAAALEDGVLLRKLVAAVLEEKPVLLSQDEANSLLSDAVKQLPEKDDFKLQGLRLEFAGDGRVQIYAPVTVKGAKIGISLRAQLGFEQGAPQPVWMRLESVQAGRLPIHPSLALWLASSHLPDGLLVQGGTLRLDASLFAVRLPTGEQLLSLNHLAVREGGLEVGFSGDIAVLKQLLTKYLQGFGAALEF